MPHKHKRKAHHLRGNGAEAVFDLPPTERAKALAVGKNTQKQNSKPSTSLNSASATTTNGPAKSSSTEGRQKAKKLHRRPTTDNDTPRAFTRLLNLQNMREAKKRKTTASNVDDDGDMETTPRSTTQQPSKKKQKRLDTPTNSKPNSNTRKPTSTSTSTPQDSESLRIHPAERLSDFAARVDHALPLSGLAKRNRRGAAAGPDGQLLRERQTKMEKRLQRMHAEWRVEEAKIKEREAEARDARELEDAENGIFREQNSADDDHGDDGVGNGNTRKKKKKGKKGRHAKKANDDDEDPWAILKTRHPTASSFSANLHDVAQAPPTFSKVPREKFKTYSGATVAVGDVPAASGSLRRREELGAARMAVIERYRAAR